MMLYRLISRMDRSRFEAEVISLTEVGPIGERIQDLGVRVHHLKMNSIAGSPFGILKLGSLLRKFSPQVVQTWMMHSDLFGGLAAFAAGRFPVVWGVHQTALDPAFTKWRSRAAQRCCTKLAGMLPAKIVCCSEASMDSCAAMGYPRDKMVVIPNGFDLGALYRDVDGARAIREELHLAENAPVVGHVARFHPQKDHKNFFQAAELLIKRIPGVHFVLCGDGVTWSQPILRELVDSSASPGSFHLLGRRDEMRGVVSAFSVATMSSAWGEAFPLSIGEAMCCEVCCVATDVGDVKRIIGTTGRVVPARNPGALGEAWFELLNMSSTERRTMGRAAREHIAGHFSLASITAQYEDLYAEIGGESRVELPQALADSRTNAA